MGAKGFYISKSVGVVGIVLGVGAVATIIALSVVYAQEKAKVDNTMVPSTPDGGGPHTTTPTPSNEPWDKYRLPKSLVPYHYNVTLWPRLQQDPVTSLFIFTGKLRPKGWGEKLWRKVLYVEPVCVMNTWEVLMRNGVGILCYLLSMYSICYSIITIFWKSFLVTTPGD